MTHRRFIQMETRALRKALIDHYLIRSSPRTPKPETMFAVPIRLGLVQIERRRGRPPRIVFTKNRIVKV